MTTCSQVSSTVASAGASRVRISSDSPDSICTPHSRQGPSIASRAWRKRLPDYPLPILRISRLAVDARVQSRGIGKLLLRFALRLALELRDRFGCVSVVVDAKAGAVDFYCKLGFRPLTTIQGTLGDRPEPLPMFLAIRSIAAVAT